MRKLLFVILIAVSWGNIYGQDESADYSEEQYAYRLFIGPQSSLGGAIMGVEFEYTRNKHNFILDMAFAKESGRKRKDPPAPYQIFDTYTYYNDQLSIISLLYGRVAVLNKVRFSANIGPLFYHFVDKEIVNSVGYNSIVRNFKNGVGGQLILGPELVFRDSFGIGFKIRFGYANDILYGVHFGLNGYF